MTNFGYNCVICAKECCDDLQNLTLAKINISSFKICQACLDVSDPTDDYKQVKNIIDSYNKFAEAKHLYEEVKDILISLNNVIIE